MSRARFAKPSPHRSGVQTAKLGAFAYFACKFGIGHRTQAQIDASIKSEGATSACWSCGKAALYRGYHQDVFVGACAEHKTTVTLGARA